MKEKSWTWGVAEPSLQVSGPGVGNQEPRWHPVTLCSAGDSKASSAQIKPGSSTLEKLITHWLLDDAQLSLASLQGCLLEDLSVHRGSAIQQLPPGFTVVSTWHISRPCSLQSAPADTTKSRSSASRLLSVCQELGWTNVVFLDLSPR